MAIGLILAGAGLLIQGAGAVAGHKAQNKAAAASERAAEEQRLLTIRAANQSADFEHAQLTNRLEETALGYEQTIAALAARRAEERTGARRSILSSDRAARVADGTARLSAGAAGVAGASVDAVLSDFDMQAAQSRQSINQNFSAVSRQLDRQERATTDTFAFTQRQIQSERAGVEANKANRIAGVQNIQTAPRANPLGTALQIGGALLDFASNRAAASTPKKP